MEPFLETPCIEMTSILKHICRRVKVALNCCENMRYIRRKNFNCLLRIFSEVFLFKKSLTIALRSLWYFIQPDCTKGRLSKCIFKKVGFFALKCYIVSIDQGEFGHRFSELRNFESDTQNVDTFSGFLKCEY